MHIFHKWGKWELFNATVFSPIISDFYQETKRKRMCKECLKVQIRSIF